jgi:hypothetical protein
MKLFLLQTRLDTFACDKPTAPPPHHCKAHGFNINTCTALDPWPSLIEPIQPIQPTEPTQPTSPLKQENPQLHQPDRGTETADKVRSPADNRSTGEKIIRHNYYVLTNITKQHQNPRNWESGSMNHA